MKRKRTIIAVFFITTCSFFSNPIEARSQLSFINNRLLGNTLVLREMKEMRDGIRLAIDIYLPNNLEEGESLPVMLIRTPYNKDAFSGTTAAECAYIIQDMRRRYASEGTDMVFLNASTDSYDTIQNTLVIDPKVQTIHSSF